MKTYQYHSQRFGSDVRLTYENNVLVKVEVDPYTRSFEEHQNANFPVNESAFLSVCARDKIPFTEIELNITAEMFWEDYGHKVDKALFIKEWDKTPADERIRAWRFIKAYKARCKRDGVAMKYPVRYLKHKPYND